MVIVQVDQHQKLNQPRQNKRQACLSQELQQLRHQSQTTMQVLQTQNAMAVLLKTRL